uniref:hypothetical protein n=1 Tax=uncultured Anaerovibrio sp. TaxID=361586 RepID=UPI0025FB1954
AMVDKLAAEFKDELANLGVRVDELEARMDNVKWSGWVRYEYKNRRQKDLKDAKGNPTDGVSTVQRIKLRLTPSMKINNQWTAHARMEFGMDANSAHCSTAANWGGGYNGTQFRVDQAWVDGKIGTATVKLGRFGTYDNASHGLVMDDVITGADVTIPFGKNWNVHLAAGRYSWYPIDTLGSAVVKDADGNEVGKASGVLLGDPSDGYAGGTWTYLGGEVYYAKDKWDFGVGYREFRGKTPNLNATANFNCMDGIDRIKMANVGVGYKFSPAVYMNVDYARINAGKRADDSVQYAGSAPNQKHNYNIQLSWQLSKKINVHAAYRHLANPNVCATYDLLSWNCDGQKGWEIGTDITLQKNVSACAYYFDGKNLAGENKLKMFYGNLNFSF